MGTALSLLSVDVSRLRNVLLFGCNEIFKHEDLERISLDFYTMSEPYLGRLLGASYLEDWRLYFSEIDQALAGQDTRLFLNASWGPFLRRNGFLAKNVISYFLSETSLSRGKPVEHDLSMPTFGFADGALSFMIASAIFMGARKIYLLGCGYTYSPRLIHHFYDALSIPAGTADTEAAQWVEDFSEQYPNCDISPFDIGDGRRWFSATLADEEDATTRHYRRLLQFAQSQGVEVINVVPDGFASPIFACISTSEFNKRFCTPSVTV